VRTERDDIGPRAELEYWKKRTSKFHSLFDQIKEPRVKAALGVLATAKSRLLARWRHLDTKITEAGNEARDNVKYLYTLERFVIRLSAEQNYCCSNLTYDVNCCFNYLLKY
jgi:dynein heavy chain